MNKDIMICGVGGQGTVLASKIIASAAMAEGNPVHSAETIGMAQRGGSVTSHVRIGQDAFPDENVVSSACVYVHAAGLFPVLTCHPLPPSFCGPHPEAG